MTDVVGSLTTELRITGRIIRETVLGLKRTGWMNVIIIVTMGSILSIFGVLMAIIIQTSVLVHNIGTELEISAYVKDGVDPIKLQKQLVEMPHIRKILFIPRDSAWDAMKKDYPLAEIDNPLPDTFHIQAESDTDIDTIATDIRQLKGIEQVQYPKSILDKVKQLTKGTSLVGMIVSLFLGTLTLFIISNTIHLLIQAKSREIEILRMMGVGNWYIRLPFLIQGAAYGLIGALIAFMPLNFAMTSLGQFFTYLGFQSYDTATGLVSLLMVLMGILVGSGGAVLAVRKYLDR